MECRDSLLTTRYSPLITDRYKKKPSGNPGRLFYWGNSKRLHYKCHDGFLDMESVLGFVEDDGIG